MLSVHTDPNPTRPRARAQKQMGRVAPRRARDARRSHTPGQADAEAFYRVRREIALDSTTPTGDRLRAIEQIESRALGKPKETIASEYEEPEIVKEMRALTPEQR